MADRREVAHHLLEPDWADRIGRIAGYAQRQKHALVEGARVSLGHPVGQHGENEQQDRPNNRDQQYAALDAVDMRHEGREPRMIASQPSTCPSFSLMAQLFSARCVGQSHRAPPGRRMLAGVVLLSRSDRKLVPRALLASLRPRAR